MVVLSEPLIKPCRELKVYEFMRAITSMYTSVMKNGVIDMDSYVIIVQVNTLPYQSRIGIHFYLQFKKPIWMIRVNPNSYKSKNGHRVNGCYKFKKNTGKIEVIFKEFSIRFEKTIQAIDYALCLTGLEKNVNVLNLFYDELQVV